MLLLLPLSATLPRNTPLFHCRFARHWLSQAKPTYPLYLDGLDGPNRIFTIINHLQYMVLLRQICSTRSTSINNRYLHDHTTHHQSHLSKFSNDNTFYKNLRARDIRTVTFALSDRPRDDVISDVTTSDSSTPPCTQSSSFKTLRMNQGIWAQSRKQLGLQKTSSIHASARILFYGLTVRE